MVSLRQIKEVILSNEEFILHKVKKIFFRENIILPQSLDKTIVFYGIRRSGKTFLLYDLFQKNPDRSLYVDFEDDRLYGFKMEDFEKLKIGFAELKPHLLHERPFFLLDEVQTIKGWERFCRRAVEKEGLNVILSGSSSQIGPSEIHTALRGRVWGVEICPFSFREYCQALGFSEFLSKPLFGSRRLRFRNIFQDYLKWGGFPEVCLATSEMEKVQLLKDYYQAMFFKDLVERYRISNIPLLESLSDRLFSSFGLKFSLTPFYRQYRQRFPFSKDLLFQYYRHFLDSLLINEVRLFAESTYRRMRNPAKIYLIDPGLARKVSSEDLGRLLENVVFIELKRRGLEVFYFEEKRECDFITKNEKGQLEAIQVCYEFNEQNRVRETTGLVDACRYVGIKEGKILTLSNEEEFKQEGIRIAVFSVLDWLRQNH